MHGDQSICKVIKLKTLLHLLSTPYPVCFLRLPHNTLCLSLCSLVLLPSSLRLFSKCFLVHNFFLPYIACSTSLFHQLVAFLTLLFLLLPGPDLCTLHPDLCTLCLQWLSLAATYIWRCFFPQPLAQTSLAPAVVTPIATCTGGVYVIYTRVESGST